MPRGRRAVVGSKYVNDNGYEYTKTADRGWVGTHILTMEERINRRLEPGEYVAFKSDNKLDFSEGNLELRRKGDRKASIEHRLAQIEARMEELQAERELLLEQRDAALTSK